MMNRYREVSLEEASKKHQVSILISTATEVEMKALHVLLKPLPGNRKCTYCFHNNQTYYIGALGNYAVAHVQSEMGAGTQGGALSTIKDAIDVWNPSLVITIGIAFGVEPSSQSIGDVIVSKALLPYDAKRVGKNIIYRSSRPASNSTLYNRFRAAEPWKYDAEGRQPKVLRGDILSGEALIDDLRLRQKLQRAFPTALGGEMEGNGLYVAAEARQKPWIVVKAICDFADGDKNVNKEERQAIAAAAAANYCHHIFNQTTVFDSFAVKHCSFRGGRGAAAEGPSPSLPLQRFCSTFTQRKWKRAI